jgi:hypothetical protein
MTHGVPDWGVTNAPRNIYQVLDLGELAARLGSIDAFDRRGDVVFLDDFEDGLAHWATGGSGAGNDVRLTRARSRSGAYSAKLTPGTTLGQSAIMVHRQPLAFWSPSGAEFSFNLADNISYLDLFLTTQDAAQLVTYGIRYDRLFTRLRYLGPGGPWITFDPAVPDLLDAYTFQTMKLVVNPEAERYARLQVNSTTYDLAAYLPFVAAPAGAPWLSMQLEVIDIGALAAPLRVDDVILTQNEPL